MSETTTDKNQAQESKFKVLKLKFDEWQQTITLIGAVGIAAFAAYMQKWEISTSVILSLLGYTFVGRTVKSMNGTK